ncbi:MAG: Ig-like domain-containing protein [Oscillospiraceae bacterium]|jgi:chitinase|nr:Ig-like domain-containing protein [Oscillospiraceae bacterium]
MKTTSRRILGFVLAFALLLGMCSFGFTVSADSQTQASSNDARTSVTATTTLDENNRITIAGLASVWGWLTKVVIVKGNQYAKSATEIAALESVASFNYTAGSVAIGTGNAYSVVLRGTKVTPEGYTVVALDSNNSAWSKCYVPSPAGTVQGEDETDPGGGGGGDVGTEIGPGTINVTAVKNADGSVTFAGTITLSNYIEKIAFKKGNSMDKYELTYESGSVLAHWNPNTTSVTGSVLTGSSFTFNLKFTTRDVSELGYTIVTKDRWAGTPYTAKFVPTQGGTGVDLVTYYGKGVSDETLKSWCTIARNSVRKQCFAVNEVKTMLTQLGEPARTQNSDKQELIDYYTEIKPNAYQYDELFLNDYYVEGVWDNMPANYGWMQDQNTEPGKWIAQNYPVGQRAYGFSTGGNNPWVMLDYIERNVGVSNANTDGWLYGYDEETENPYLWHKDTGMFLTYENPRSLSARVDYINQKNLGGCIIWEMSGDNTDTYPMTKLLADGTPGKRVVGYFTNWSVYNDFHQKQSPADLPWDIMTHINYSFIGIENNKIASMDDWADTTGATDYGAPAMFAKAAQMKEAYPDTKLLLSVGGWTRGDTFHAMVSSPANRATFIQSVVDYIKKYPQFDGIDLDWEYPGNTPRAADHDDPYDRGCPTGTTSDYANYTSIVTEMRTALDANFAATGQNIITVCTPADPAKLDKQNIVAIVAASDFANVMTYDYHGAFDPVGPVYTKEGVKTNEYWDLGYNSPLYSHADNPTEWSTDLTINYLMSKGISPEKLNIGTPYYSRGWAGIPTITQDGQEVPAGLKDKTPFDTPDVEVGVSSVTVSPKTASIDYDKTIQLAASVAPITASNTNVIWSSSNTAVATVDQNGLVSGVSPGIVTITATSEADSTKKDTAEITLLGYVVSPKFTVFKVGSAVSYRSAEPNQGYAIAAQVITIDNRVYTVVRDVAEALGLRVGWDDATGSVTVKDDYNIAYIQYDTATVNIYNRSDNSLKETYQLDPDQYFKLIDTRSYAPARALVVLAQKFGYASYRTYWQDNGGYVLFTTASFDAAKQAAAIAEAAPYLV